MGFELKAELVEHTVLLWHIVPAGSHTALCNQFLTPGSPTVPLTDLARRLHLRADQLCLRCANAYRLGTGRSAG